MSIIQWKLIQTNILVLLDEKDKVINFPKNILHGFKDLQNFVAQTCKTHQLDTATATHIANLLILLKEDSKILTLFETSLTKDLQTGYITLQQFEAIRNHLSHCYIFASKFEVDNAWTSYRAMGMILSQQYTDYHFYYGLKGAFIGAVLGALSLCIFGLAIAACANPWAVASFAFLNMTLGASGGFLIGSGIGSSYKGEQTSLLTNLSIFKVVKAESKPEAELKELGLQALTS